MAFVLLLSGAPVLVVEIDGALRLFKRRQRLRQHRERRQRLCRRRRAIRRIDRRRALLADEYQLQEIAGIERRKRRRNSCAPYA